MELSRVAQDVLASLQSEGVRLTDDLTHLEQVVREAVLRIGAKAVELHLQDKRLGYEGSGRACDGGGGGGGGGDGCGCGCGADQKFVGHRPRVLATLLGQVTIKRAYYHRKRRGASCCPYDRSAGLGANRESVGLSKAAALLAAMDPFIPAATVLRELAGQRPGDRTPHRVARAVGAVASERERQLAPRMAAWSVPPPDGTRARPARLYVAVDGAVVRRDQWNEAERVTCYWEVPDGEGGLSRQARYAVRFESAEPFEAFAWSLAMQCGLEAATEVVLPGDGAAWVWEHVGGVLGAAAVCVTDWCHVMQHAWSCGNALRGRGTDRAKRWVEDCETRLWHGDHRPLIERLGEERGRTRSPANRRALAELIAYLTHQGERLAYARFRAEGYDIGSGRVEPACKHVVADRMKRSGMMWSEAGAQDVLSLRTAYLNGRREQLWATKPLIAAKAA